MRHGVWVSVAAEVQPRGTARKAREAQVSRVGSVTEEGQVESYGADSDHSRCRDAVLEVKAECLHVLLSEDTLFEVVVLPHPLPTAMSSTSTRKSLLAK